MTLLIVCVVLGALAGFAAGFWRGVRWDKTQRAKALCDAIMYGTGFMSIEKNGKEKRIPPWEVFLTPKDSLKKDGGKAA